MTNFTKITKIQGFLISLVLSFIYTLIFYLLFREFFQTKTLISLTFIFCVGVILHFARIIPPGEKARLCFFGKDLKTEWEDGFCFVPSVFPFLHYYGIYLLWDILVDNDYTKPEPIHTKESRPINQTAMTMNWIGHSKMSAWQAFFANTVTAILYWFVDINPTNRRLILQRIGTRIIVVCLIFSLVGSFFAKATLQPTQIPDNNKESINSNEGEKPHNKSSNNSSGKNKVCIPNSPFPTDKKDIKYTCL